MDQLNVYAYYRLYQTNRKGSSGSLNEIGWPIRMQSRVRSKISSACCCGTIILYGTDSYLLNMHGIFWSKNTNQSCFMSHFRIGSINFSEVVHTNIERS